MSSLITQFSKKLLGNNRRKFIHSNNYNKNNKNDKNNINSWYIVGGIVLIGCLIPRHPPPPPDF